MNNGYKLFISVLFFSLLLIPIKVSALDDTYNRHPGCTYSDIVNLKAKIKLVNLSYDYDVKSLMSITATNLQSDFYIVSEYNDIFKYDGKRTTPGIATIDGYFDGQTVALTFIASSASKCSGEKVLTTAIKLPRYNPYFGNKACEGIDPDKFSLCSKWYPTITSEVDFLAQVKIYKEAIKVTNEVPDPVVKTDKTVIDYILDNYYYVLLGILGVTSVLIIILSRIDRKRRVL